MRQCWYCEKILIENDFYQKGNNRKCKECVKKQSKQWKNDNPLQKKRTDSLYYKKHAEKLKIYTKNYRLNNPEKYNTKNTEKEKQYMRNYSYIMRDSLCDLYVKSVMKDLGMLITPETIKIKRQLMKINRLIKNKNYG